MSYVISDEQVKDFIEFQYRRIKEISKIYDGSGVNTLFRRESHYFDRDDDFGDRLPDGYPEFDPKKARNMGRENIE